MLDSLEPIIFNKLMEVLFSLKAVACFFLATANVLFCFLGGRASATMTLATVDLAISVSTVFF